VVPDAVQLPVPSHARSGCATPAEQAVPEQTVPSGQRAQAFAPSHIPLVPHEVAGSAAHSSPGSVFAATGPHSPSKPAPRSAPVHASHMPLQARSQQTPSAQKVLAHSWAAPQRAPAAFTGVHVPLAQ
jgi:hypothetical protein